MNTLLNIRKNLVAILSIFKSFNPYNKSHMKTKKLLKEDLDILKDEYIKSVYKK